MRSSGSAYGRTCPERPCSGGRHCRKVGHANPQAPTSWRGPMGPACLRAAAGSSLSHSVRLSAQSSVADVLQ